MMCPTWKACSYLIMIQQNVLLETEGNESEATASTSKTQWLKDIHFGNIQTLGKILLIYQEKIPQINNVCVFSQVCRNEKDRNYIEINELLQCALSEYTVFMRNILKLMNFVTISFKSFIFPLFPKA